MGNSSIVGLSASRRSVLGAAAGFALIGVTRRRASAQSTAEWRIMRSDSAPPPRWDHSLIADDEGRRLIVFGGRGADFGSLGDTWVYSFADRVWSTIDSPGPEPRFGHAVAADPDGNRMLLFGGQSADLFFNDAWAFDFETLAWTKLHDGAGAAPSPRYGLAAVLDDERRLLISHGFTFEGRFNDTWAFGGTDEGWTDVSPGGDGVRPLNRCLHEQAWDPDSKTMLLFGGCSSGFGPCPQGDLWRYDPSARTWMEITPSTGPSARTNPALVHHRSGERFLLIGGSSDAGYMADVWAGTNDGDGFAWTSLEVSGEAPLGRASHDAVVHRGDVYLFGGTSDSGSLNDLWKLSLG